MAPPTADKRVLRGARTRRIIARHAADIASQDGLDGLSLGRLAEDLGLSKSGVQTLFVTKERLQLAAVEAARSLFAESVVTASDSAAPGLATLRALIERWIEYAAAPLFRGGCFWGANLVRFGNKPGPVRDALVASSREWTDLLTRELGTAISAGEVAERDVELTVFQLDALLLAANTRLRLGDTEAMTKLRRTVDELLRAP
ncbi:TetR/AcrR family transcriptional regulator [Nocardia aurantia]|nr:TetR/AcrR family transcriptional regulator [Nocardia aurantia]